MVHAALWSTRAETSRTSLPLELYKATRRRYEVCRRSDRHLEHDHYAGLDEYQGVEKQGF